MQQKNFSENTICSQWLRSVGVFGNGWKPGLKCLILSNARMYISWTETVLVFPLDCPNNQEADLTDLDLHIMLVSASDQSPRPYVWRCYYHLENIANRKFIDPLRFDFVWYFHLTGFSLHRVPRFQPPKQGCQSRFFGYSQLTWVKSGRTICSW